MTGIARIKYSSLYKEWKKNKAEDVNRNPGERKTMATIDGKITICGECRAMVVSSDLPMHKKWHEKIQLELVRLMSNLRTRTDPRLYGRK